jgi:hypothetical protein
VDIDLGELLMGKVKTASDYEAEIRIIYPPRNEIEEKQIKQKVGMLADRVTITILRARNEQDPWPDKELGWEVRDMLLKEDTGLKQVGDYWAYYSMPGHSGYVGVLVERKGGKYGAEDLYSTLMNSENCARFYREIDRFYEDLRFSQMVIIAECSFEQFLLYKPPFIGKTYNSDHIGASVAARRGKIASLYARGVPVIFAGTRKNAIEIYKALIRQWIIKNYVRILGLDKLPYDDEAALLKRKAELEASLTAVNHSLEMIGVSV